MAADLPSEPFNREEQYLADIAGQNVEVPPCPWNRKEAYLAEIGGRLDTMDDRISALATDLSFKGSVATENDLPADAAVGDTYITEDTGIMYVWVGDDWIAINDTGGGGITELTSANYNYHKTGDTDDSIAPWLLNQGLYLVKAGTKMWFHKNQPGSASTFTADVFMIISATSNYLTSFIMVLPGNVYGGTWRFGDGTLDTVNGAGSGSTGLGLVRGSQIIDNLTSTDSDKVLSANQGKVLNDKIGNVETILQTLNSGNGAA